jgi:hypothetical protein
MNAAKIASSDFSKSAVSALKSKGITFHGFTFVPGEDGSYANGERAYELNDNGTLVVRTYMQVKALAA